MICALVAPEHQGCDLLLRTNCVSWILIILFASPAWHGFVIYPSLEMVEEVKKKKKKPCRDCSKLHLPKQTELLWLSRIVAEMQQWYFPSMLPPIQRKVGGKSYLLSNAGILTSVHMWRKKNKHFSVSIMRGVLKPLCGPFFQVVNMPSEAQRTSHQSKNVPADVRPGYLPMSSGILFILVGTEG